MLALRAAAARAAVLFAGYSRTAEVQTWLDRGWLRALAADRPEVRHTAPRVRVTADSDLALERDPAARAARLPHEVFELMRSALPQGPVLVQVPRAGYRLALVCQDCREPVHCLHCSGPHAGPRAARITCVPAAAGWQVDWECPICGGRRVRSPVVGAQRTAEELGKAFPQTPIKTSVGGKLLDRVPDTPGIVVATPGAEPTADGGYAGAVLLDTALLLLRPDLRAAEEALRRWLNVVALVRSGADGGSVIAVGESSSRALQALVRVDPGGFAARELADRAAAHFPPAAKLVRIEGPSAALAEFLELADLPAATEVLGPVEVTGPAGSEPSPPRLTLRGPVAEGAKLVHAAKDVASIRSARKSDGALRIVVDPAALT